MGVLTDEFCCCIQVQIRYWSYLFRRAGELPLCNFAGKNSWTLIFFMSLDFINHGGACYCHADPVSLGETCFAPFANALTEPYQMLVCCVFVALRSLQLLVGQGWLVILHIGIVVTVACGRQQITAASGRLLSNVLVGHWGINQVASFLPWRRFV